MSSSLHRCLDRLHSGQGSITWLRVYSARLNALFGLAFAPAPPFPGLTLPRRSNSPAHYAKGTRSGLPSCDGIALPPLVGKRFQVLFHSPHRGSFRLSLTVLVHYRSPGNI